MLTTNKPQLSGLKQGSFTSHSGVWGSAAVCLSQAMGWVQECSTCPFIPWPRGKSHLLSVMRCRHSRSTRKGSRSPHCLMSACLGSTLSIPHPPSVRASPKVKPRASGMTRYTVHGKPCQGQRRKGNCEQVAQSTSTRVS